jgi:hypothetical protein
MTALLLIGVENIERTWRNIELVGAHHRLRNADQPFLNYIKAIIRF